MNTMHDTLGPGPVSLPCELRFESLFVPGRALTFPCDRKGRVAVDRLSDRARKNYLYARAVVGREFAAPAIVPGHSDWALLPARGL